MFQRMLSATVLSAAGAALIGGALGLAPAGQAAGGDSQPPCLAEHSCALLIPRDGQGQAKYLPLTPASSTPQNAPLTPR